MHLPCHRQSHTMPPPHPLWCPGKWQGWGACHSFGTHCLGWCGAMPQQHWLLPPTHLTHKPPDSFLPITSHGMPMPCQPRPSSFPMPPSHPPDLRPWWMCCLHLLVRLSIIRVISNRGWLRGEGEGDGTSVMEVHPGFSRVRHQRNLITRPPMRYATSKQTAPLPRMVMCN